MSKSDPVEKALNALGELRHTNSPETLTKELRAYFSNKSNLVVAKAAKIAGELHATELVPELVAAFERLMKDPQKLDKRCAAVTEIVGALYEMDYCEPEVYLRGLRHVQKEASFGPPVDTAAALRGMCAQGLLRTRYRDALTEVLQLLVDREPPARLGAVRALALNGGEAGALLLRLKALTGDTEPEVLGQCFSGLLAAAPEQSLAFVAKYVDDEDESTAGAAIWALGESRLSSGVEILKENWERTVDRDVRRVLLAALAASRLQEGQDFLCSLLRSANSRTASDVLEALAPYAGSEIIRQAVAAAVQERGEASVTAAFKERFSK
ncbi:MAG: HEAT repeat domain-containing protein [Candidatus Korobacteraceae bacterium]